jgi:hypothetical protein
MNQVARIVLLSFSFLVISVCIFAQDGNVQAAKDLVEIADEVYFVQKAPDQAREMYVQDATLDPENIKANWI